MPETVRELGGAGSEGDRCREAAGDRGVLPSMEPE
jgi:hypothetical protein